MHLQTFNTSWDYHLNNQFSLDDISSEKVQHSINLLNQAGSRITEDPLTFLLKNDLVRDGQIANATYLLFKKNDSVITTIELGRFQTEIIIKDTARTKADILTQIEQVLDFVTKHINKEVIITGKALNTQKWQYPLEAIREIITNMIVHRDYRSSSDSIVKVFDNKIEFYNPGRLPDSITVDDLLNNNYKSTPRNKLIADFFKNLGLIEKYGSGIRRIIDFFVADNLPVPEFRNISDGFMVTVFSKNVEEVAHKVGDDVVGNVVGNVVDDRLNKILSLISDNNQISALQIAKLLNVTSRTIQRDIEKLKELNKLKRSGLAKGGQWEIITKVK